MSPFLQSRDVPFLGRGIPAGIEADLTCVANGVHRSSARRVPPRGGVHGRHAFQGYSRSSRRFFAPLFTPAPKGTQKISLAELEILRFKWNLGSSYFVRAGADGRSGRKLGQFADGLMSQKRRFHAYHGFKQRSDSIYPPREPHPRSRCSGACRGERTPARSPALVIAAGAVSHHLPNHRFHHDRGKYAGVPRPGPRCVPRLPASTVNERILVLPARGRGASRPCGDWSQRRRRPSPRHPAAGGFGPAPQLILTPGYRTFRFNESLRDGVQAVDEVQLVIASCGKNGALDSR